MHDVIGNWGRMFRLCIIRIILQVLKKVSKSLRGVIAFMWHKLLSVNTEPSKYTKYNIINSKVCACVRVLVFYFVTQTS